MSNYWSWEGPKNWWHMAPEGTWTFIEPRAKYGYWIGGAMLLLFGWMLVNTPYTVLATVYLFMLVLFIIMYSIEMAIPRKTKFAVIMPRATPTWLVDVFIGIICGTAFALLYPISGITMPLLAVTPIAIANFLLSCFAIPFVEEYIWGGVFTATTVEDFGIIPGLLFVGFMFPAYHWAVVGNVGSTLVMLGTCLCTPQ